MKRLIDQYSTHYIKYAQDIFYEAHLCEPIERPELIFDWCKALLRAREDLATQKYRLHKGYKQHG